MIKTLIFLETLLSISSVSYASENKIENISLWVFNVCFIIFAFIFVIATFLGVKELVKFNLRKKTQIKMKKKKLLQMYTLKKYYYFTLFLCSLIFIMAFSFMTVFFYERSNHMFLFSPILTIVICIYLVYLIKPSIKNSILCAKDKIAEKYMIADYCASNKINDLSKKLTANIGELLYYGSRFSGHTIKDCIEAVSLNHKDTIINVGVMSKKIRTNLNAGEGIMHKKIYCSFVEYNLPFTFDENVSMYNVTYIDKESSIIPKYDLLPPIICSKSNKAFAEKLINETIQEYLLELATRIGNYAIHFSGNRITLIMFNVLWSTASSRIFNKNASIEGTIESIDEVIKCFDKIVNKMQEDILYRM